MRIVVFVLALSFVWALGRAQQSVSLPPGETSLMEIGCYRVGYQSYGGEIVWMSDGWVGHFEPVAGISYLPGERILERPALLLHSPWHIPPGRTFVEYPLVLPNVRPITLRFGIAMRPDVVPPASNDRSDGVTFSAAIVTEGQERELFREHYAKGEWRDYEFDLSAYAGKQLTLRLQVEPGPQNSPSFDFSYWGDPKIIAGEGKGARQELLRALLARKAYQAIMKADLRAVCNNPRQGVTPSNLLPCRNALRETAEGWAFTYSGADAELAYIYRPQTGTLTDFTCVIDGGQPIVIAAGGGLFAEERQGEQTRRVLLRGGQAEEIRAEGARLHVRWRYDNQGQPITAQWTFGIEGKALIITVDCAQPVLVGFSLGNLGPVPLRRTIAVPYLLTNPALMYLPTPGVFVLRYLNWKASNASYCPGGEATYDKKTDGMRNPLHEEGYIALSPHVWEVLPNIPWPPSPYLRLLAPRIMLDVWAHHKGTFQGSAENLRNLKDNGIDHLAIINHVWQHFGYDVKLPDHIPANPDLGGDEGMIEFGKAANEAGYIWSCHENYIDLYPDAPSYDETAVVLRADGSKSPAWYNPGTKVQSFGLKCNRAKEFAEKNAPYIHKTYRTTAAYLDVHTCVPPWHQLDHDATQPMAAMARAKVEYDSALFQYMRDTHGGPLFGEGANHFYWAGACDGVEAQVAGGEDHTPFLDFDLLKLHPQMMNHGMGYYERWFREGYRTPMGRTRGTMEDIDKYRAQELAYGHAGFVGSMATNNVQWVAREHHLCHPIQALYGAAKPVAILYEVEGQLVPASLALALGDTARQCVKYDSGLTLWINWRPEPWHVGKVVLPQWGFLAEGPQTRVWTALQNGKIADYAECPEYVFADARTYFEMPYRTNIVDIEPRLKELRPLGGNRFAITYEWLVNAPLETDYHVFVHFVNPRAGLFENDIVFQNDHAPPKPTSQWRPGERIVDGPYEVTVPDGPLTEYDIVIGLYTKGGRLALKGPDDSTRRIVIGRLLVKRDGEKATEVSLGDISERVRALTQAMANFNVRLNPPGTMIDFGKVATDGSVKINLGRDRLVVFPYPREREFTVTLNLPALLPQIKSQWRKVEVCALAIGTQAYLGPVAIQNRQGRVSWRCGQKGVGRYLVRW